MNKLASARKNIAGRVPKTNRRVVQDKFLIKLTYIVTSKDSMQVTENEKQIEF